MEPITTKLIDGKFICDECKNENTADEVYSVGDVIECEYCGIEYRVIKANDDGSYLLELLEEEK